MENGKKKQPKMTLFLVKNEKNHQKSTLYGLQEVTGQ